MTKQIALTYRLDIDEIRLKLSQQWLLDQTGLDECDQVQTDTYCPSGTIGTLPGAYKKLRVQRNLPSMVSQI